MFLSPYRCRSCGELFWALGRRFYRRAIVVAMALIVGAVGAWMAGQAGRDVAEPEGAPSEAARIEGTINLANENDPAAEYELARMYAGGDGVPQSEKERLVWLERSAEHGNPEAQYEMGIALRYGRGVIQDYARAAALLEQAAQSGHGHAQYELGLMYRGDAGIGVDNVKAYTWLNLAAAQGIVGADVARDRVLYKLSPDEIAHAQAEARRLSQAYRKPSVATP
jgi:TPR repeat protein